MIEQDGFDEVYVYAVGDPGRAASRIVPSPSRDFWNEKDIVISGARIYGDGREVSLDVRAASVRGLAHQHFGKPRQDNYGFRQSSDSRYLVLAISDGVSSGSLSHLAAETVTGFGCQILIEKLQTCTPDQLNWAELVRELSGAIVHRAKQAVPELDERASVEDISRHMAATALFAIITLSETKGELPVVIMAVGDTTAWKLKSGSSWEAQYGVDKDAGYYRSSNVTALPRVSDDSIAIVRTSIARTDVLALLTDGVGDPLGDGTGPVGSFLATAWQTLPHPLQFAAQVSFARRSHDDDRTAVCIWRSEQV